MEQVRVALGIDGGGTRTRCLVADLEGRVLGEGAAGPANCQAVGYDGAAAAVHQAAAQALDAAGVSLGNVVALCAGLAGAGRPEDQAMLAERLLPVMAPAAVQVVADARIALEGAHAGKPGVVVIAGTGSIAYGLDARGHTLRAGGWGWLLGDEGSGFALGRGAVQAMLAHADGSGPATALTAAVCDAWGLERPEQAIRRIYADPVASRSDLAALAPAVVAAAEAGDRAAGRLLEQAGCDLAALAAAVLRQMDGAPAVPAPVAVTGGVLAGCARVRNAMAQALGARAVIRDPMETPVRGAVRMALALARRTGQEV